MRKQLTAERLREVLRYEPDTGLFTWRGRTGLGANAANAENAPAGSVNNKGYVTITVDGHQGYKAHRLAWLYMTGDWPTEQVDHRDTVRHNNAWENLRQATRAENAQNQQRPSKNNKSGYLGVSWDKQYLKWAATLHINGRNRRLGRFANPESAHAAYLSAKAKHHPFANILAG
jgi:hypothetical protein